MTAALCQFEGCAMPDKDSVVHRAGAAAMWVDKPNPLAHAFVAASPVAVPESTGAQETVTLHRVRSLVAGVADTWASCYHRDGEQTDPELWEHAVATITRRKA
jgi:hypothetical protein